MLQTIKDMLKMLQSRSKQLKLSLVLSVVENILVIVPILIAFKIIGSIPELNPAASNQLTVHGVIKYTIIMVVCVLARIIVRYYIAYLRNGAGYEVMGEQRKILGKELRKVSMGYFNEKNLGDLVSTITSDASYMELYGIGVLEKIVNGVLAGIIGMVLLFIFDYRIALVVCLLFIPTYFAFKWISNVQDKLDLNRQEQFGILTEDIVEYIKGLHVLKTYNMTTKQFFKTKITFARFKNIMLKLELSHVLPAAVLQFCFRVITIAIILLSSIFVIAGQLSFQSGAVLMLSSFSLFSALEIMGTFAAFIRLGQYSMDRINQIKEIKKMDDDSASGNMEKFNVEFEDVSFAYEKQDVLQNISFSVPEKSMTAMVGMSGSGKTTIVNLLARFWDIEQGTIRIGGKDVKSIPYEMLLKNLSFVFQDVFLFDDTVLNNIRIGRPDASMEEVVDAARKAGCHEFICQMENGYHTIIGEAGARLSGGERQRISIARALIKNAPIVLLDEVTANVDVENEQRIQMALRELLKDRTVIIIAHKLSTIQSVNQILVLENGHICQKGSHRELVTQDGLYKRLWDIQYQTSKWKI